MENNATPRPWAQSKAFAWNVMTSEERKGFVCACGKHEDAALIVEAVNNYALLKEENQKLRDEMKDVYSAGLMCERILSKDQIEKLTAANAELINLLECAVGHEIPSSLMYEIKRLLSKHSST